MSHNERHPDLRTGAGGQAGEERLLLSRGAGRSRQAREDANRRRSGWGACASANYASEGNE